MNNNKIKVFARIKPPRDVEKSHMYEIKANKTDNGGKKILLLHGGDEKYCVNSQQKLHEAEEFFFENIFTENATQECIYNCMAKPVIERAIEGFNGTIMAYGQTGTGKTHTICGGRDKGIIPRSFKQVFYSMKEMKQSYKVFLSVMEIYNEHAYDLLTERFTKIGLKRDKTDRVTPRNLTKVHVSNMHQLDKLLKTAWNNRIVSETPMNDASSRSHCIFSLHLHQTQSKKLMISKVHMIDLSGSEKLGKRRPSGILLNETRHINLSLHYIELVIRALSDKNRDHIPYRNSMITSFLRDSLGGNSNTVMVFTVSLEPMFFEETVLTCRFAQRVSLISNKMKKQISQNQDMEIIPTDSNERFLKNEFAPADLEEETGGATLSPTHHKGITCRLDLSSASSSSSNPPDSDKISFEDEELSKYIDEILTDEDPSNLNYCYEKHHNEEKKWIIELQNIQKNLSELSDLTKAMKKFPAPKTQQSSNSEAALEYLGLSLPLKNPHSGEFYTQQDKEDFFKFLSRELDLKKFKIDYHDEYCNHLAKEYTAFKELNETELSIEKIKAKLMTQTDGSNIKRVKKYERALEEKESDLKEKDNSINKLRNERHLMSKKMLETSQLLIERFHAKWLESNDLDKKNERLHFEKSSHVNKKPPSSHFKKSSLRKSTSSIGDYVTNEKNRHKVGYTILSGHLKGNNTASETKISRLSHDLTDKSSTTSESI